MEQSQRVGGGSGLDENGKQNSHRFGQEIFGCITRRHFIALLAKMLSIGFILMA